MEEGESVRKRKGYYRYLQRNVEFYLSDANLRRDKFMRSKLSTELELDISVILACNRVREMGATVKDLETAIKPSKCLELIEGNKVRRKFPIVEKSKDEVDKCTVYVERLPPDTTHDWLTRQFSKCGSVVLVSMPKYRSNKKVKGYAFVEFAEEAGCQQAVEKYTAMQAPLSCHLCQPPPPLPPPHPPTILTMSAPLQIPAAESKEDVEENVVESIVEVREDLNENSKENGEQIQIGTVEGKKKRNRKKKKWQRRLNYTAIGLQVMSKLAWNELRDRYLSVQASNRRAVKSQLGKLKRAPVVGVGVGVGTAQSLPPATVLTLTPVHAKPVSEPQAKALRGTIKQACEGVEYVDVEPGQQNGYVRMSTPQAAAKALQQQVVGGYRLQLLAPEAEPLYWVKIQHDRDRRRRRRRDGTKNVSGARKLLLRAERQLAVKMRLSPNQ